VDTFSWQGNAHSVHLSSYGSWCRIDYHYPDEGQTNSVTMSLAELMHILNRWHTFVVNIPT
jgi:hypothetical protein